MQTLALICRYLSPRDLLSAYHSCKLLSAAASHPLTFQNGCQTGLSEELGAITTYARGPSAVFTNAVKMKTAFESRLFCHFRIVHLYPSRGTASMLSALFPCFTLATAPSIRSLTIDLSAYLQLPTAAFPHTVWTPEVTQAMTHLRHLHLIGKEYQFQSLMASLPPSVELLHLTYYEYRDSAASLVYADELLQSSCGVRTVLYDIPPRVNLTTSVASLLDLHRLTEADTGDRLEKIVWNIPIDGSVFDLQELAGYSCAKLESLCFVGGFASTLPSLARFPSLTRLCLRLTDELPSTVDAPIVWPESTRQLEQLSIDRWSGAPQRVERILARLADGDFPHLHTLRFDRRDGVGDIQLAPLMKKMPQLTDLRMPKTVLSEQDAVAAFQLVPQLRSLRDFAWPFSPEADLAAVFPSLTRLQISQDVLLQDAAPSLQSIPRLVQLSWRDQPVIHPREIPALCAQAQLQRDCRRAIEKELREEVEKQRRNAAFSSRPLSDTVFASSSSVALMATATMDSITNPFAAFTFSSAAPVPASFLMTGESESVAPCAAFPSAAPFSLSSFAAASTSPTAADGFALRSTTISNPFAFSSTVSSDALASAPGLLSPPAAAPFAFGFPVSSSLDAPYPSSSCSSSSSTSLPVDAAANPFGEWTSSSDDAEATSAASSPPPAATFSAGFKAKSPNGSKRPSKR
jgi:hypothetical protein